MVGTPTLVVVGARVVSNCIVINRAVGNYTVNNCGPVGCANNIASGNSLRLLCNL